MRRLVNQVRAFGQELLGKPSPQETLPVAERVGRYLGPQPRAVAGQAPQKPAGPLLLGQRRAVAGLLLLQGRGCQGTGCRHRGSAGMKGIVLKHTECSTDTSLVLWASQLFFFLFLG